MGTRFKHINMVHITSYSVSDQFDLFMWLSWTDTGDVVEIEKKKLKSTEVKRIKIIRHTRKIVELLCKRYLHFICFFL